MAKDQKPCEGDKCKKTEFLKPYISPYSKGVANYDKKVAGYISENWCAGQCGKSYSTDAMKLISAEVCTSTTDCPTSTRTTSPTGCPRATSPRSARRVHRRHRLRSRRVPLLEARLLLHLHQVLQRRGCLDQHRRGFPRRRFLLRGLRFQGQDGPLRQAPPQGWPPPR